MWWAAISLIAIFVWTRWRLLRAGPRRDFYGSLGYGDLSSVLVSLVDALAIAAAIYVLIAVLS
jgi:hypothetical protein